MQLRGAGGTAAPVVCRGLGALFAVRGRNTISSHRKGRSVLSADSKCAIDPGYSSGLLGGAVPVLELASNVTK